MTRLMNIEQSGILPFYSKTGTNEISETPIRTHKIRPPRLDLEIRNSLEVDNIVEDIKQYQRRWVDHLEQMDRSRLPRLAFQYQPRGWRDRGRPRARWKDKEQVLRPKP
jgi:hypothetical protein